MVVGGKLDMVVLVDCLSDRYYSKQALLNADAVLLLIQKHPVSAIKLIIGTPKQIVEVWVLLVSICSTRRNGCILLC